MTTLLKHTKIGDLVKSPNSPILLAQEDLTLLGSITLKDGVALSHNQYYNMFMEDVQQTKVPFSEIEIHASHFKVVYKDGYHPIYEVTGLKDNELEIISEFNQNGKIPKKVTKESFQQLIKKLEITEPSADQVTITADRVKTQVTVGEERSGIHYEVGYLYDMDRQNINHAYGSRVVICNNGMVLATGPNAHSQRHAVRRIQDGAARLVYNLQKFEKDFEVYCKFALDLQNLTLDRNNYYRVLGYISERAATHNFDSGACNQAIRSLESNSNKKFVWNKEADTISAWSVYNHFTESLKGRDLLEHHNKHKDLSTYFQDILNLEIPQ